MWCLKPGQSLPCHTHKNADDVWIVLQGEGTFITNHFKEMPIKAGDIFVSFPGDAHGMVNTSDEDFIMLGFATQCLLISINTKAKMNVNTLLY